MRIAGTPVIHGSSVSQANADDKTSKHQSTTNVSDRWHHGMQNCIQELFKTGINI